MKSEAYQRLKKTVDRLIPPEWTGKDPVGLQDYAVFIQQTIRLAASEVLDKTRDREFLHLDSARYDDGTWMLSVTGLICGRGAIQSEIARLKIAGQPTDLNWVRPPALINVPHLSMQERIRLDEKLPIRGKVAVGMLQRRLGYWVSDSAKNSEEALRQYASYYQEYPTFIRSAY